MNCVWKMAILVVVALVSGCATNGVKFADAPKPEVHPDTALVYVYRAQAIPILWAPTFDIDGKAYAQIPNETFTWFYVQPGNHAFHVNWPIGSGGPDVKFDHKLEAGKGYGFEIRGAMSTREISSAVYRLNLEDAQDAAMACCNYVAPSYTPPKPNLP